MTEPKKKKQSIELPHKIVLDTPIKWGEETISTIEVKRALKAKDFKGINASGISFDDMIRLCSKITGEELKKIEDLDATDFFKVVEVLNHFLPSGLKDGGNQ